MARLALEAQLFTTGRQEFERAARRLAAVRLCCGIDLGEVLAQAGAARSRTITRVRRMMERERLRGAAGGLDYNLDRHIALGESLRLLEGRTAPTSKQIGGPKQNGARRRRRK